MCSTVSVSSSYSEGFAPDVMRVEVTISGKTGSRQASASAFNRLRRDVIGALASIGVGEGEVKSGYFGVSALRDDDGEFTGEFGYYGSLSFETACAQERYDEVWAALVGVGPQVSFDCDYDLSDWEGAREQILRKTVEIGRRRAALLADAVGCDLGEIASVRNDVRANEAYYDMAPVGARMMAASETEAEAEAPEFVPEPIDVRCSVELAYELVPRMRG